MRKERDKEKSENIRFRIHGAADETQSESEAPASVTCFSMDFTRWSSEE